MIQQLKHCPDCNRVHSATNGDLMFLKDHLVALAEKEAEKEEVILAMDKSIGILLDELARKDKKIERLKTLLEFAEKISHQQDMQEAI